MIYGSVSINMRIRGQRSHGSRSNKGDKQRQMGSQQFQVAFLPPASAVEVIESEPSFCECVCEHSHSRPNRVT